VKHFLFFPSDKEKMIEERESKRLRRSDDRVVEGDQVRLVNLPAFPGLEGLIATVVGVSSDNVDVRLHKTGVTKRVCSDSLASSQFIYLSG
jgi:hypothetical protein